MNTNRRGFFGALAGLAGGVYAAFVPGKRKVWGEDPKDWQINNPPKEYWDARLEAIDVTTMKDWTATVEIDKEVYHLLEITLDSDEGVTYTCTGNMVVRQQ